MPGYIVAWLFTGVIIFIFHPFTILVHELGHAIISKIYYGQGIAVFLGNFGNKKNCFRIKVGRITYFFTKNPLKWQKGVCISRFEYYKPKVLLLVSLGGPAASFLLAIACFVLAPSIELGFVRASSFILGGLACLDFICTILPYKFTFEGMTLESDGWHILNSIKLIRNKF